MSRTVSECWARFALERFPHEIAVAPAPPISTAALDTLGVGAAGARHRTAQAIASLAVATGGRPEARLWAGGASVPAARAAEANAVAAHCLELDDGHRAAAGHPGAIVFPTALAVGEWQSRSGAEILAAARLGYEWFVRLGATLNPGHLNQGFHSTSTVAAQTAALVSGLLMGFDANTLTDALGHAGLRAAGLLQPLHEGADAKPLQVGAAVGSGVAAAQIAALSLSAPRAIMEGEDGLLRAFAATHSSEKMLDRLGHEWWSEQIYVKQHSACRHTHAAIDLAIALHRELPVEQIDQIDSVSVETYAVAVRLCGTAAPPETAAEGRFSLPFTVARALLHGDVALAAFEQDGLQDVATRALATRVTATVVPDLEALFPAQRAARLRLRMRSGEQLARTQIGALGDPERPLTKQQLTAKIAQLLGDSRAERLAEAVDTLDVAASCGAVTDVIVAASANSK